MTYDALSQVILDSLEDHVAVIAPTGIIVATNAAWKKFATENNAAFVRTDVATNYLEICRRAVDSGDGIAREALLGIQAVLDGRQPNFSLEYPCHSPATRRWYLLRVSPLRNGTDGVVVSHVEITRRKEAEIAQQCLVRQLGFERARLDAIFDSATNPIIFIDRQSGYVQANPEAERLFGHALVPAKGRPQYLDQIRDPAGRRIPYDESLGSRALRGETSPRVEVKVVRPDGSQVPCLENAAPVLGADSSVEGAVVVFQDISPLKELERVRQEWTSVVAHDLSQPVTVVNAYAQRLLQAEALGPEATRASLTNIARSAERLARMIADLVDVSRVEARQLRLTPQMVDLPNLLRDVVARLRMSLPDRQLRVDAGSAIQPVMLDPVRTEQVLANLVTNAVKYGYPDTDVVVELTAHEGEAIVSVTNQGPGIRPEDLARLFTRFYRTREAQGSKVEGLGLGLYISKGLVEAQGGRIWAESTPRQTTFSFSVPISI